SRAKALSPDEFEAVANETSALILDTRDAVNFANGFIPNSINIGIDGNFAVWVGTLVPCVKQEILIVADEDREEEVITRLARVGYDYALGFIKGGMEEWKQSGRELDVIPSVTGDELVLLAKEGRKINFLDVRKRSEYLSEHLIGAENIPLDYINDNLAKVNPEKTYHVYCAGGYRSMVFNSILK